MKAEWENWKNKPTFFLITGITIVLILLVLGIGALTFSSLYISNTASIEREYNERIQYDLQPFTGVELLGHLDVSISQGDSYSLTILSTIPINPGSITFEIVDSTLTLDRESGVIQRMIQPAIAQPIKILITTPAINKIKNFSSARIYASELKGEELSLEVSGSGTIEVNNIKKRILRSDVIGSGHIILSGDGESVLSEVQGSGSIDGALYRCQKGSARVNGSGKITINATQTLDAQIKGSGTVRYLGEPQLSDSIKGSGKIIRSN